MIAKSVFKMLPIAIFVALLLAGVSGGSDNALLKLQEIALRIQLEAQASQLQSNGNARGSNLPEVGLTIVSFETTKFISSIDLFVLPGRVSSLLWISGGNT